VVDYHFVELNLCQQAVLGCFLVREKILAARR